MKKSKVKNFFLISFLLFSLSSFAQSSFVLSCVNKPLNKVLIDFSDDYDINISFDDKMLSDIYISIDSTFADVGGMLHYLISETNLSYELDNDVWLIYPSGDELPIRRVFSGNITDAITGEPLPYADISCGGISSISDISGNFSCIRELLPDSMKVRVSYLGYYILDTMMYENSYNNLNLMPSSIGLTEIVISDLKVEKSTQFGYSPGLMKINHKIAHYLPGYGDNSVFNLIRLMPGILASGEQTSELIIWGSYAGQCKVDFDGYTVYGLRNFNDNISSFNPLLAKDIEIHKGGYNALYGGRVGGIVNIVGKTGDVSKPSFTFNINNMTLNAMADIPLSKRSSLIVAFRHTYYNLYSRVEMTALVQSSDNGTENEFTIKPSYSFRDANIKYSLTTKKNNLFYISLHGADDLFSYYIDEPVSDRNIQKDASEENQQLGGSAYYGLNWKNGNVTNLKVGYSGIATRLIDVTNWYFPDINTTEYKNDENDRNFLSEITASVNNTLNLNSRHILNFGFEYTNNTVQLEEYSFDVVTSFSDKSASLYTTYLQDKIWISQPLELDMGLRVAYSTSGENVYIEPRVSANYQLNEFWKIYGSAGIYNQFIALSTFYDDFGNFKYFWTICGNEDVPILNSTHFVLGTSYHKNNFTFNLEGYHKNTTGLTRFVNLPNSGIKDIFHGNSHTVGMDILLKEDYRKHSAWVAYSLSQTLEHFQYYEEDDTRRAPQDQLHEIKLALMLNFDPIFFSSNFVFGSGFPHDNTITTGYEDDYSYNRLDVSLIYKFLDRKLKGETGISVLNVLNHKNLKYTSFEKIPAAQTTGINFYTESMPITPTIYLKIML